MAQQSGKPIKTFSIGFQDEAYNELPQAKLTAQRYGTQHHELVVQPIDADFIQKLVHYYNEPFADSSAVPTFYLSEFTRRHVTVALSGDGGDELFSGYHRYGHLQKWGTADIVPQPVRATLVSPFRSVIGALPYGRATARCTRGLYMLSARLPDRYDLEMSTVKPEERDQLYAGEFREHLKRGQTQGKVLTRLEWEESMDELDWMMRNDQSFYLPDCLMVKVDVASMAHGLEVRCPFVDHTLMEFASRIPSRLKRSSHEGKIIFKSAIRSLLPEEILQKPKPGCGLPVSSWLRRNLNSLTRSMLLDDVAARRGMFNVAFVRSLIDEHMSGRRDWGYRLWSLLMLEMWFREFVD
jgi:asparagine synthase (glutamine-hydrolysing)